MRITSTYLYICSTSRVRDLYINKLEIYRLCDLTRRKFDARQAQERTRLQYVSVPKINPLDYLVFIRHSTYNVVCFGFAEMS
jgi:hypothetical protein